MVESPVSEHNLVFENIRAPKAAMPVVLQACRDVQQLFGPSGAYIKNVEVKNPLAIAEGEGAFVYPQEMRLVTTASLSGILGASQREIRSRHNERGFQAEKEAFLSVNNRIVELMDHLTQSNLKRLKPQEYHLLTQATDMARKRLDSGRLLINPIFETWQKGLPDRLKNLVEEETMAIALENPVVATCLRNKLRMCISHEVGHQRFYVQRASLGLSEPFSFWDFARISWAVNTTRQKHDVQKLLKARNDKIIHEVDLIESHRLAQEAVDRNNAMVEEAAVRLPANLGNRYRVDTRLKGLSEVFARAVELIAGGDGGFVDTDGYAVSLYIYLFPIGFDYALAEKLGGPKDMAKNITRVIAEEIEAVRRSVG